MLCFKRIVRKVLQEIKPQDEDVPFRKRTDTLLVRQVLDTITHLDSKSSFTHTASNVNVPSIEPETDFDEKLSVPLSDSTNSFDKSLNSKYEQIHDVDVERNYSVVMLTHINNKNESVELQSHSKNDLDLPPKKTPPIMGSEIMNKRKPVTFSTTNVDTPTHLPNVPVTKNARFVVKVAPQQGDSIKQSKKTSGN